MADLPPSDQSAQRRAKLAALRELGNPYPNDFRRSAWTAELVDKYADRDAESLEEEAVHVAKAAALNGYMREDEAQIALREAFVTNFEAALGPTSGKLRGQIKH